jgi:hypothetical protein
MIIDYTQKQVCSVCRVGTTTKGNPFKKLVCRTCYDKQALDAWEREREESKQVKK